MIVDPGSLSSSEMYRFMIGVIVPRPIAFVSSVSADGAFNAAPFSFFCGIASAPPLLGISINLRRGAPKDTLRNLRATGDFVVNVVNEELLARVVHTSGDWPPDVDEIALTGLTPAASERVKAPRVAESPVQLECRVEREVDLGGTVFVIGEILWAHVSDGVLTDGRVDPAKLKPAGRLGGDGYMPFRELIRLPRPQVGT